MASIAFRASGFHALKGDLDMDTIVLKATLVMSNYDGAVDDDEVADITTLDEMDGGYSGGFAGTETSLAPRTPAAASSALRRGASAASTGPTTPRQ